ncbi:TonB-dependent receptor domain-containing protein [Marinimicrobium sp. ARAG 43.8]|uniref:TonB-dependent receptor domain-containing protein n=1 Tax=Marinimicrobium sp. ARAG 43.8 TaxID=3418719 RepID=UPI003CF48717
MNRYCHWLRKSTLSVLIATAGLHTLPANAQIESASLRGKILNEEAVEEGSEVVAVDVARGYTYTTRIRANNSYTFVGLRPGTYRIHLSGQEAGGQEVTLRVGQNARLNVNAEDTATNDTSGNEMTVTQQDVQPTEEILVTSEQVDSFQGGGVSTDITPELMNRLPQINRNFLSFAELAPGVQLNQGADGSTSIRGGAQHQRGVNVFLDGVSQKDYVLKGGVTGQDSSRGNPFPQSAVAEYKVITQNYKAEYEHVGSTAITAITQSGTNEFKGDIFYDFTDESLRSATPLENDAGEKVASSQEQYGLTLSGPIIRDKLHYFLAYERKNNEDPRDIIAGSLSGQLPAQYRDLTGRKVSQFQEDLFFGKIDWMINSSHAIEASIKYREEAETTGFGGTEAVSYGSSKDLEDTRVNIKHTYTGDGLENELRFTYEDSFWRPRPLSTGYGTILENGGGDRILAFGAGPNFQNKGQEGWSLQNDITFSDISWFGDHVIKTGIKYKEVTLRSSQQIPYYPQFYYNVEFDGEGRFDLVQPYRVEWGLGIEGTDNLGSIESDNRQVGIYIQDDWYITDRLTLNLGVRWDYEETPAYKNFVTPDDLVTALRDWDNIQNAGYDINQWISNGHNRDYFKDAWAPRLGFSYDLDTDGTHVLFGGYGRSYDRNQFDYIQIEQTKGTFASTTINFEGDPDNPCEGSNCVAWDPAYLTPDGLAELQTSVSGAGREVNLLHNDLKTPYSDQFSLGIRSTWGDWATELTLSRIEGKDGFNWLLGNRREGGAFFAPGTTWGAPWGFNPEGYGDIILANNDLETKTNSVYLKIEHPHYNNWGVSVAYTYSDAQENVAYTSNYALDYPDVSYYGWQDAVGVPDHRVVATGTLDLPWDILLSGKLTWASSSPQQYTNCLAGNDDCFLDRIEPDDGDFSQFDLALSKHFSTDGVVSGSEFRVRFDILNLFDTHNWRSFDLYSGSPGDPNPDFGVPQRDLASPPRTAKLSVGWSW